MVSNIMIQSCLNRARLLQLHKRSKFRCLIRNQSDLGISALSQPNTADTEMNKFLVKPLNNLSMKLLMNNSVHLGHSPAVLSKRMLPFIVGERSGIHIIDVKQSQHLLTKAGAFVREMAYRNGVILFVGTKPKMTDLVTSEARRCQSYFVTNTSWIPGTLTNMREVLRTRDESISNYTMAGDEYIAKAISQDPSVMTSPKTSFHPSLLPNVIVCFNPMDNKPMLREALKLEIPVIAPCDTDCDPRFITFPVPCNDDNLNSLFVFGRYISESIIHGRLESNTVGNNQEVNDTNNNNDIENDETTNSNLEEITASEDSMVEQAKEATSTETIS